MFTRLEKKEWRLAILTDKAQYIVVLASKYDSVPLGYALIDCCLFGTLS
jgi:hypothetical protein